MWFDSAYKRQVTESTRIRRDLVTDSDLVMDVTCTLVIIKMSLSDSTTGYKKGSFPLPVPEIFSMLHHKIYRLLSLAC